MNRMALGENGLIRGAKCEGPRLGEVLHESFVRENATCFYPVIVEPESLR
jgi:hypothetical protein